MAWARDFLRSNPSILDEAAILLLRTFDHAAAIFLFFADEARLVILPWIRDAPPLLKFCHFLAVGLAGECSLIILSICGHFDFGPVIEVVVFEAGHPFLIIRSLRKIMFFVAIRRRFRQTARNFVEGCQLVGHVVEFHTKFRIRFAEVALKTIRIHVSDFDTGLPFVEADLRAFDSLTLTVIIECISLSFDFYVIRQVMNAEPRTSYIICLAVQLIFVGLWWTEAEGLRQLILR